MSVSEWVWVDKSVGVQHVSLYGRTDGRTDGRMDGWMNRWVDGWVDEWIGGWMDVVVVRVRGWIDG